MNQSDISKTSTKNCEPNVSNNITHDRIVEYLSQIYRPESHALSQLRENAEIRGIPIIGRDTEGFLSTIVRLKKPARILEIGTAVGYSAMLFAQLQQSAFIVTIDHDRRMVEEANLHINDAGLSNRISVLCGDGLEELKRLKEVQLSQEQDSFDLVFIDAAKGHYQAFFDACLPLCSKNAIIVSDNILYKGITASEEFLKSKRDKTIMRRMRSYLKWLTENNNFATTVLPVGDGIAISIRRESNHE